VQIVIVRGTGRGDSCMKVNKIKAKKTVALISPMLALTLLQLAKDIFIKRRRTTLAKCTAIIVSA